MYPKKKILLGFPLLTVIPGMLLLMMVITVKRLNIAGMGDFTETAKICSFVLIFSTPPTLLLAVWCCYRQYCRWNIRFFFAAFVLAFTYSLMLFGVYYWQDPKPISFARWIEIDGWIFHLFYPVLATGYVFAILHWLLPKPLSGYLKT